MCNINILPTQVLFHTGFELIRLIFDELVDLISSQILLATPVLLTLYIYVEDIFICQHTSLSLAIQKDRTLFQFRRSHMC